MATCPFSSCNVASKRASAVIGFATAPPNTLRIGPPLSTTPEHIDMGLEALSGALGELEKVV